MENRCYIGRPTKNPAPNLFYSLYLGLRSSCDPGRRLRARALDLKADECIDDEASEKRGEGRAYQEAAAEAPECSFLEKVQSYVHFYVFDTFFKKTRYFLRSFGKDVCLFLRSFMKLYCPV